MLLAALGALVGTSLPLRAANSPVTGAYPQLDTSARGTALGGDVVALTSGSDAVYWNPAGLLSLEHKEISFSYSDLFGLGLVKHTVAQFGWPHLGHKFEWQGDHIQKVNLPPPANLAFGLGWSAVTAGLDSRNYVETQLALSFAWRMASGTQFGLTYRLLKAQSSADSTADGTGSALDFGMQRRLGDFRIGLAAANLTSSTNWKKGRLQGVEIPEESDPLAQRWSAGLAWVPKHHPIAATFQGDWAGGGFARVQYGAGLEWNPAKVLILRVACRDRQDVLGSRTEMSGGLGFRVKEWQFDYGWQDSARDLGATQRWSAAVNF